MSQDSLYARPRARVNPFCFDEQVVRVFDDMLDRSVPFYREILLRQVQLVEKFHLNGSMIYDLGCSHGNLGMSLLQSLGQDRDLSMVAVDSSAAMLERYRLRLDELDCPHAVELRLEDMCTTAMENASVVVINLTLQFLPLQSRDALIQRVYDALLPGGVLLLTEKLVHEDEKMANTQRDLYYGLKMAQGYSELEISQKRDALENVMIPETLETHLRRLKAAGFAAVDPWFKWFNFCSLIARKDY